MDKLLSIASSGTGSYRYRADGLRAWKGWNVTIPTTSGIPVTGATYFLYDGGNPVAEMDSSGTVTAVNVFAHDGLVARVEGSTAKYYQFDAQGSVAHRTNSSGAVTSSSKYEAYGKHVNIPGSTVDVYGWNARWGYYYDSETGLYLCQQRYYDSNQGRWLNRDPIGYAGGVNVYGYCGGGPVLLFDETGKLRDSIVAELIKPAGVALECGGAVGVGAQVIGATGIIGGCLVVGTTIGGLAGTAIDNATGGAWGRNWGKLLGVIVDEVDTWPVKTIVELPQDGPNPEDWSGEFTLFGAQVDNPDDCDEIKDNNDAICRKIKNPYVRRKCFEQSQKLYSECLTQRR